MYIRFIFVRQEKIVKAVGDKIPKLKVLDSMDIYRENLVQIEIYFEEFNYKKTTEFPAYLVSVDNE